MITMFEVYGGGGGGGNCPKSPTGKPVKITTTPQQKKPHRRQGRR